MSSCMKYFMALYCPMSRCFFCSVPTRSVFDSARLRLFSLFILLVWEITLGWILRECAFSLMCAQAMGFCTVRKCSRFHFPSWCSHSTQSSILLPSPPPYIHHLPLNLLQHKMDFGCDGALQVFTAFYRRSDMHPVIEQSISVGLIILANKNAPSHKTNTSQNCMHIALIHTAHYFVQLSLFVGWYWRGQRWRGSYRCRRWWWRRWGRHRWQGRRQWQRCLVRFIHVLLLNEIPYKWVHYSSKWLCFYSDSIHTWGGCN